MFVEVEMSWSRLKGIFIAAIEKLEYGAETELITVFNTFVRVAYDRHPSAILKMHETLKRYRLKYYRDYQKPASTKPPRKRGQIVPLPVSANPYTEHKGDDDE